MPAGCAYDPPDQLGLAGVLAELITRGAGNSRQRELTLALDNLGARPQRERRRSTHALLGRDRRQQPPRRPGDLRRHPASGRTCPRRNWSRSRRWPCRTSAAWRMSRGSRVLVELRKHLYPTPLSNDHRGTVAGIESHDRRRDPRRTTQNYFRPQGTILSVAGNIDGAAARPGRPPLRLTGRQGERAALTLGARSRPSAAI